MSRFALANLCGLVFGALTVLSMLPMSFPDKRAALLEAFFNRFAIGFVVILIDIPCSGWLIGLSIGIVLSFAASDYYEDVRTNSGHRCSRRRHYRTDSREI